MSDRVLVTGGTGFLGSHVARVLHDAGRPVRVLARPTSDLWRLEGLAIEIVRGDVLEPETLGPALAGIRTVYHLAGLLGGAPVPDSAYHDLNVAGTRNVLTASRDAGVARLLHVSSPGVLGPISNPPADETWPHAPSNIYELTKSEGEKAALEFAETESPSVIVVRPEFVYGPGDTHVLGLFRAIQKGRFFYIGSGNSQKQPTFVDDAVRGMVLCEAAGENGRVYHVAGPAPVTVRELASEIAQALNVSPPWLHVPRPVVTLAAIGLEMVGKVLRFRPPLNRGAVDFFSQTRMFSTERAQAELGYRAQLELPDGVRRTVDWYRERGLI